MEETDREKAVDFLKLGREMEKRRKADRLARYNVGEIVHEKQLAFHRCKLRNRWVFGGNRSGKTECGAVEAVWMLRGVHPYRENRRDVRGWSVSLTQKVQREVAQAKILEYLRPDWIENIVMDSGKASSPKTGIIDTIAVKNVFGGISTLSKWPGASVPAAKNIPSQCSGLPSTIRIASV